VHFGLLDLVRDATNLIDNLCMKPGDKIATYNVEFMQYAVQLNWGDTVLCHVSTGNHLQQSLLETKLPTRSFPQYGEGGSR